MPNIEDIIVGSDRLRDLTRDIRLLTFYISGIEVTQGVQYYHSNEHLTDPADQGADNSIRLVRGKPAWVRVYTTTWFGSRTVTGTLLLQRRVAGILWVTVATLNPQSPGQAVIHAHDDYATIRGSLSSTLNFIIPADQMCGTMRLIARTQSGAVSDERTQGIQVTLEQTLRLAGVMISYNGPASSAPNAPNLTIAAPTLADLQAMAGTALTLFPVQSTANFRSGGSISWNRHLQDPFGATGCTTNWDALHAAVVNARTADGNQAGWIYYGLLPGGVPMGPVGGCGGGGVSVGPVGQPGTLAHEAAHACGLQHAPCGGAPRPDTAYPAYEPYDPTNIPQGSTGEYGLDINNGNVASPAFFKDFMSYCRPNWISPYHYAHLTNTPLLNPKTVCIDLPWWKDWVIREKLKFPRIPLPDPPPFDLDLPVFPPSSPPIDVISLIVRIERGKVVEVSHVARTRAQIETPEAVATSLVARLRGSNGEVASEAPLLRLTTEACGCRGRHANGAEPENYLAQAFIPDTGPGLALEITDGKTNLWERKAPAHAVAVGRVEVSAKRNDAVVVSWSAVGEATEYWVRWSRDGEHWQSVATGLTETRAQVDLRALPPGKLLLQIVAHDGFYSHASKPVKIQVPERGPDVSILHPNQGFTYQAGQTLRLWGSAATPDGKMPDAESSVWLLNGKEIGHGLDIWIEAPRRGKHVVELRTKTRTGTGKANVNFNTATPDHSPEESA